MRKLLALHVFTVRRTNYDRFYEEQYKVRRDFEQIYNSNDEKEISVMLDKYELFIEQNFEPYAAMHESRQHSNLWGKMLLYSNKALQTDHIGYYKPVLMHGEPTTVMFNEQYPHMVTAWMYDEKFLNDDFKYEDTEKEYLMNDPKRMTETCVDIKEQLDEAHK